MTLLLLFALIELHLAYWHKTKSENQVQMVLPPLPLDLPDDAYPLVTVQLPVFNEQYVAERVIDAVAAFDYPRSRFSVQVLDDSTDLTLQITRACVEKHAANGLDIVLLHRIQRESYKAGALQAALASAKGEWILIFDADFVPLPNFLRHLAAHFSDADPALAAIQVPWAHLNANSSWLTQLQAFFLDFHFGIEQTARYSANLFLHFNGTAGAWRKSAIEASGGWQGDTLTEDIDLSYRAQLAGWKIKYVEALSAAAELPPNLPAFFSQQHRWIKGGAETARKHIWSVLRSRQPFVVKIHAAYHLLAGSTYLVSCYLLLMAVFAIHFDFAFLQKNAAFPLFAFVLLNSILVWVFYQSAQKKQMPLQKFMWLMSLFLVFSLGLSLRNGWACLQGWLGWRSAFVRTPKFAVSDNKPLPNTSPNSQAYIPFGQIPFFTLLEGLLAVFFAIQMGFLFWQGSYIGAMLLLLPVLGLGLVSGATLWQGKQF